MQSKQAFPLFIALVALITFSTSIKAQNDSTGSFQDSIRMDSSTMFEDSIASEIVDSTVTNDTIPDVNLSKDALESKVTYKARDTIKYNFVEQKVLLYGNAIVTYEDIELKAEYIELKMDSNIVFARGVKDSTGRVIGNPVFKEGGQEYRTQQITYNFMTGKGKIDEVITQKDEGYIHGKNVKKMDDDVIYIQNGLYTTCEHGDPHFSIWAKQLKVIPNDKIVVKPANLIIEDVNTPILVPFGIFPNRQGGKSGIIIPMPTESQREGFALTNGGYYFYMGEKADLTIKGDIYTKGGYAIRPEFRYKKRYKRSGYIKLRHKKTVEGVIPEDPAYKIGKDYWVNWNHRQETSAHPNSSFKASVEMGTKTSFTNDINTSDEDFLKGNFVSQISYTKNMFQNKLNFSVNARQNQNQSTGNMNITLPEFQLNAQRFFPFKSKKAVSSKWYDNIGLSYNGNFKNDLTIPDSLPISIENLDTISGNFRNGVQHSVPIGMNFKVLKFFTLNPSVSLRDIWYFESTEKYMDPNDTNHVVQEITHPGFVRGGNARASANLTTKVYGMMQFRNSYVRAVRHVLTPSVGVSYVPENNQTLSSYTDYSGSEAKQVEYSTFYKGIYGTPNTSESGKINMSLLNNLEMKVKSQSDTGDGSKKIKILENLKLASGYDFLKDSLKWDNVGISGNSNISRRVTLNLGSTLDLYALNSTQSDGTSGTLYRSNQFEWNKNRKLARMTNGNVGFTVRLSPLKKPKNNKPSEEKLQEDREEFYGEDDEFNQEKSIGREVTQVNWDIPWSLSVKFSLQYKQTIKKDIVEESFVTNTNATGDLSLTKNWKITYDVRFDTENWTVNFARFGITRNLHCWEMTMDWTPTASRASYNFRISVRASVLKESMKYDKKSF